MFCNTLNYWTNFSYHTQYRNANYFSNLNTIFDGTGQLVCDLQMSQVVEVKKELVPLFNNIFVDGKTAPTKDDTRMTRVGPVERSWKV